jgi:hypothetical protein
MIGAILASILLVQAMQSVGPIQVSADFESGHLGTWRVEGKSRLVIRLPVEYDQDKINSTLTWFYGRLSNVLQREVTVEFEGLDYTVYNGKKGNILPFERNTAPVFSYDGIRWERFTDCVFNQEARTFRIRQIFGNDSVWIAYIPPYTYSRLETLISEIRRHPGVSAGSFGRSVDGRNLHLVDLREPDSNREDRPTVWIVARQHAFEAGGSWAIEGLLRFLISPAPEAVAIRRQVRFRVCPMLNPDGVVRGGTRFNARGVDLNRHWHAQDPYSSDPGSAPEIALLKHAIRDWRKVNRLDLWINIHNNDMVWNEDGDYIRFAPVAREPEARRLEALLRRETIYTGPFEPAADSRATEAVVAAETGALGLLMEMKTGYLDGLDRWTGIDIFLAHGRGLARAISQFFN